MNTTGCITHSVTIKIGFKINGGLIILVTISIG